MWRLVVPRNVVRSLDKLPAHDRARLTAAMHGLGENPFGGDFKKLFGSEYRLRVGSYRIVYEVDRARHAGEIHRVVRRTSTTY